VPVRIVVPPPDCTTAPVPEIALLIVRLPVRLKANVELLVMLAVPSEPVEPPLPICSVPELIVASPANEELSAARASTLAAPPCWTSVPCPETAFVSTRVSLRLKASVEPEASDTVPVPRDPAVPPPPTCNVPAETDVVPT